MMVHDAAGPEAVTPGGREFKILIHYTALNRGGAEKSLVRLMAGLARRGCEVHLVLTVPGGDLEPEIDPAVVVHHLRRAARLPSQHGILASLRRLIVAARSRLEERSVRVKFRALQFDAAIVGRAGMPHDFVCGSVKARKRFVFVRNDPAVDSSGRWAGLVSKHQRDIDNYICVSRYVQSAMEKRFPQIKGKLKTIYNLIQPGAMRALAAGAVNPFGPSDAEIPRVLSVCRLQENQKALLRMVEVHRRLLAKGVKHTWHVVGDGPDRALLEQAISAHGLEDTFVLHGEVSNPFPWYVHADLVAVLSRYEGLCGVVNEARVLERPVIATRFSGIEEQLESGVNGLIVEQEVDSICEGLASLIRDRELRDRLGRGGYPRELLDDEAKVDMLLSLLGEQYAGSEK